MIEATVLVPTNTSRWGDVVRCVCECLGGFSQPRQDLRGYFKMKDGRVVVDNVTPIVVAVDGLSGLVAFHDMVHKLGVLLGQEAMYVQIPGVGAEVVQTRGLE